MTLGPNNYWHTGMKAKLFGEEFEFLPDLRGRMPELGQVYLEMVEPVIGQGNAKEWLETRGEGIFHLGYATDNLGQRRDGTACVFESWGACLPDGSAAVIHLDTVEQLGYYLELTDRKLAQGLNARIDAELAMLGR